MYFVSIIASLSFLSAPNPRPRQMPVNHASAVSLWAALGVATFPVLFRVSAPYGKLVRDGWGPRVDGRWGWFVQEIVSPVTLTAVYLRGITDDDDGGGFVFDDAGATGRPIDSPRARGWVVLFLALWWAHYVNRAVVYPLSRRMSDTTLPVVAMAVTFNLINGTLMGAELAHGSAHLARPRLGPLAGGLALFALGAAVNVSADRALRRLRKSPADTKHYVPRGGLFERVACPHYLGEVTEWIGFALATQTRAGWAFAFWTFANLLPRAVAYRAWYREKFGDKYPKRVRAMIPFVW